MAPIPPVIAIDGPGASGKSTVGRLVARRLGYGFIDTGGMYRALTWLALLKDMDFDDDGALTRLAEETPLTVLPDGPDHQGQVVAGGRDLSPFLRHPEVDAKVSLLSRVPGVRVIMVANQRAIAEQGGVVMAGRDIGTVVLPDAPLKIYLDASVEERAGRRFREQRDQGLEVSYDQVLDDLRRRDDLDGQRATSPLRPAADAHKIDTDGLTPEEIADAIIAAATGRRLTRRP